MLKLTILTACVGIAGLAIRPSNDAAPPTSTLGPPTICFPVAIGDAPCLPFAEDSSVKLAYEPFAYVNAGDGRKPRLIVDALDLLKTGTPFVRMETLRRATYFVNRMAGAGKAPSGIADQLLSEVLARALDASAAGEAQAAAHAWLDAAWLAACYADLHEHGATRQYDWVTHAMKLRGVEDGVFEFAASVITWHARPLGRFSLVPHHENHLRRAAAAAAKGSLLEENLSSRWTASEIAKLRAKDGG